MKKIFLSLILILSFNHVLAQEIKTPLQTINGLLRINHDTDKGICSVSLNAAVLYIDKCDSEYDPYVIKSIKYSYTSQYDGKLNGQIVAIQRIMAGNATSCMANGLILIDVSEKFRSSAIRDQNLWGGCEQDFKLEKDGLRITIKDAMPPQKWFYRFGQGSISKVK
jgi:hypothetical protein